MRCLKIVRLMRQIVEYHNRSLSKGNKRRFHERNLRNQEELLSGPGRLLGPMTSVWNEHYSQGSRASFRERRVFPGARNLGKIQKNYG
jgi:hypothetical protein